MIIEEIDNEHKLTRKGVKPLYSQIYDYLYELIHSGDLPPGSQLPSENELVEKFNVSRITVRHAIAKLEQENLLVRMPGKGTFIAEPKIDRELINILSFTDRMEKIGKSTHSRVISVDVMEKVPERIKRELQIDGGTPVVRIERVRYSGEEAMSIERTCLSLARFPNLEQFDFERNSLYKILEQNYHVKPSYSHKTIEMTYCNSTEAKLLGITRGSCVFLLQGTIYSDKFPVEFVKILLKGNRFRFQI